MTELTSNGSVAQSLVQNVANWLMEQALRDSDLETVVLGCCERLHAAGIELDRGYFAFTILHPLYRAMGLTWTPAEGVAEEGYPHVPGGSDAFRHSPHHYMMERDLDYLRCRLTSSSGIQFDVFDDLRRAGLTDYLAFTGNFTPGDDDGMMGSWATRKPGGFSDDEISALLHIQDRLAVACKMAIRSRLTANVATTYLGEAAGERVLCGQIRRGDGDTIRAAILSADLRGSTTMADRMNRQDFIDVLNAYFDAIGGAVTDAGGEILSFIGDSVLAIFSTGENGEYSSKACRNALMATSDAWERLEAINKKRQEAGDCTLQFGTGLHIGKVMFGNVGIPERLTFSVFGSAVNEVVRLEQLTKDLNEPVLLSPEFASAIGEKCRACGDQSLRGFAAPIPVYAPPKSYSQTYGHDGCGCGETEVVPEREAERAEA